MKEDAWEKGKADFRDRKSAFDEKVERIVFWTLDSMAKEGLVLDDVDTVLSRIKNAAISQVEAVLKQTVVKAQV